MENLKEIRFRISSVTSTRQITNAMKMVSAAKLRKAQDIIIQMRPYANKLQEIFTNICKSLDYKDINVYEQIREVNKVLVIVITSNKGLCGAFNLNAVRKAVELADEKYSEQLKSGNVDFITIGKKGHDLLKLRNYNIVDTKNELFDHLSFDSVKPVIEAIMESFVDKQYDKIELIYNHFKNAAVQILIGEQFLPIVVKDVEDSSTVELDYIFEPSKQYIVKELIPETLKIQFYKALLDSNAAEYGARMTAMHKATDNATELISELRLNYNKVRQASITDEILEIISGAEALKG